MHDIFTDEEAQAAATASNANGQITTSSQTHNKHLRVAMNNNSNPMIASTLNHIRSLSIRRKSTPAAGNHGGGGGGGGASNGHHQPSSRKKSTDRTTRLLIVILVLFLITEFPQVSIIL